MFEATFTIEFKEADTLASFVRLQTQIKMGHTWNILKPTCLTLSKKYRGDQDQKFKLFEVLATCNYCGFFLYFSLEEIKSFEEAGCQMYIGHYDKFTWERFYEELKEYEEKKMVYFQKKEIQLSENVTMVYI